MAWKIAFVATSFRFINVFTIFFRVVTVCDCLGASEVIMKVPIGMTESTTQQSTPQIAKFMGPTWSPSGSCRSQMGPMLAPWTLLSGTWWTQWTNPELCCSCNWWLLCKHMEAETTWAFRWWNFPIHYLVRYENNCVLIQVSLKHSNLQKKNSNGSDNALAPNKWQAIIWNDDGLAYWCIYALLSLDEC